MTVATDRIEALLDHDPFFVEGSVKEIAADGGQWDHKIEFNVSEIQKGLAASGAPEADAKPMFVEVLVIHEGHSKNKDGSKNVGYGAETIKDIARLLPGTIGYLGHQEPSKQDFEYRTPAAKYVASRIERRDVKDVGNVPCVIGKAYVSAAARDFRTHLREGMAGPVSISGTALFRANHGVRTNETVGMSRLRSVDFCNPGTPGIAGAGVVGVVREIAGNKPPTGSPPMADRLSRKQLQVEYADEIDLIVKDETAAYEKTIGEVRETAGKSEARAVAAEKERDGLKTQVSDLTKARDEQKTRADKAEGEVREMRSAVRLAAVKDALSKDIDGRIETAKKGKDAATEVPVLEMARKRVSDLPASVLVENDDKDNTLSVKAAGVKFDAAVAEVREMAKAFGGPKPGTVSEMAGKGKRTEDHPEADDTAAEKARLLPSTAKRLAREAKAKEGAGSK